ncbi:hypothetical protein MU1_11060 [Paenibacillus glycanilyticus]|uniref:Uncharacterized protein n=2 Tax=Paenibacillus glycanilyticus TaxID=126569 RepID=A0ABQ6G830_9BACL|nr:hypothetical protein MU1_11060 [Paenibacillus glycanilyticus]
MNAAVHNAVYDSQWNVERTHVSGSKHNMPYYFARIDKNPFIVEKEALYLLQTDASVPQFKFVQFHIGWFSSYSIHVTVEYPGAFGISRKLDLHYTEKVIAFKHETGPENYRSEKQP